MCNALVGGTFLFSLLFAIPNVTSFMEYNSNRAISVNLAVATYQMDVPYYGALGLTILLIVNLSLAGIASVTSTSRIG